MSTVPHTPSRLAHGTVSCVSVLSTDRKILVSLQSVTIGCFSKFCGLCKVKQKKNIHKKKLAKWCKSREKDVLVFVMLVLCRLLVQIWDSSLVLVPSQEKYQLSQLYLVRKMLIIIRENPVGLPNSECVSFSFCFSCLYNFPKLQDMERRSG